MHIWSIEGYVTPDGFTSQSSETEDNATSDSSDSNAGNSTLLLGYNRKGLIQKLQTVFFESAAL